MNTQRHLHRTAVFAIASAVFAASATGTAFAWVRSDTASPEAPTSISAPASQGAAQAAAATVFLGTAAVVPTAAPSPRAVPTPAGAVPSVEAAAKADPTPVSAPPASAKPTAVAQPKKAAGRSDGVTISRYVDQPGSQAAIDKCNLVLWTHSPMWLAGHNWCGWQWMAFVPTGTTVTVTTGPAAGTYVVTGHVRLTRQSGELPQLNADLVLQTCVGNGTGLTLLNVK